MNYKYGDVVLYCRSPWVVVGVDNEYGIIDLLNKDSFEKGICIEEVKKIGYEDGFKEYIDSMLSEHVKRFNKTLLENQEQVVTLLAGLTFFDGSSNYYITGETKADGDYLYCQVREDNFYDWILVETLMKKLFGK